MKFFCAYTTLAFYLFGDSHATQNFFCHSSRAFSLEMFGGSIRTRLCPSSPRLPPNCTLPRYPKLRILTRLGMWKFLSYLNIHSLCRRFSFSSGSSLIAKRAIARRIAPLPLSSNNFPPSRLRTDSVASTGGNGGGSHDGGRSLTMYRRCYGSAVAAT